MPYRQQMDKKGHNKEHAHNRDKLFVNELKDIKNMIHRYITIRKKKQKLGERTQERIINKRQKSLWN